MLNSVLCDPFQKYQLFLAKDIDFVEEHDGKIFGYEFKCGKAEKKVPLL
jgi:hypothetical protein